jgi:hypothetical protein
MITKERIAEVEGVLTAFDQLGQRVEKLLEQEIDQPGDPASQRSQRSGALRQIAGDLHAQRNELEALWS